MRRTCLMALVLVMTVCSFVVAGEKRGRKSSGDWVSLNCCKEMPTHSSPELDQLVLDENCTRALASGWERVRRTVPSKGEAREVGPDRGAVARFLELVEKRLRVPVPEYWREGLYSVRHFDGILYADFPSGDRSVRQTDLPELHYRNELILAVDGTFVHLPLHNWSGNYPGKFAFVRHGETLYLMPHYWPSVRHRLYAIDRKTGRPVWSTGVWGDETKGLSWSGSGWYDVELAATDDSIVVFGNSDGRMHIEVYSADSGSFACMFNTDHFPRIRPRQ